MWAENTFTNVYTFRDWDLWGPLVLCLGLGALLSLNVRVYCSFTVPNPS